MLLKMWTSGSVIAVATPQAAKQIVNITNGTNNPG